MKKIRLPIDTKSLFFNIKNDNLIGHTATVASPLRKTFGDDRLDNILLITDKMVDLSNKGELIELLVKHSKSSVQIRNMFVFDKLSVNGKMIFPGASFGCYVKEEVDESKVQFGRLKLHYPSKLIFSDIDLNISNKLVYQAISASLNDFAFIIRSFSYDFETETLDFDALVVGENDIPYSKVFINEKGAGNKFTPIFNENADDYDREIIALRNKFGSIVNPNNYLDYFKKMKNIALEIIKNQLNVEIENISAIFPYSLFDFIYSEKNVRKYGILRVTSTKSRYFNLSLYQQAFVMKNKEDASVFLVSNIFESPCLNTYKYSDLSRLTMFINSIKYEED